VIVLCIWRLYLHLVRDVPGRLRGRNARRTNQRYGNEDRTNLTSHLDLHFQKPPAFLQRPEEPNALHTAPQ
jgi:hypothetical protein